jgi:hypothetical protein
VGPFAVVSLETDLARTERLESDDPLRVLSRSPADDQESRKEERECPCCHWLTLRLDDVGPKPTG